MEEKKHFDDMKLKQLRADIQAGISSGDAGTLDAGEIKQRGRARHADALRETERRYESELEEPVNWEVNAANDVAYLVSTPRSQD